MAGIKIRVSTAEAAAATQKLSADLARLGATSKLTETQIKSLEARMLQKMGMDKASMAIDNVAKSIGMTSKEIERFKTQLGAEDIGSKFDAVATKAKGMGVAVSIAATMIGMAFMSVAKKSLSYLGQIETATLGIAAAYMVGGTYIDETSKKALAAEDALRAAQVDSRNIIKELQYANLQTIATLDELINAYQVTLPVALAKGFNRTQVKEFTVAMVQAAGAIGLRMDQLSEETRSLLTGQIRPGQSRVAQVLGLRPEDIKKFKSDGEGLFNFLMEKLSAYRVAGIEAQNTWAGLWSNTKDIAMQALGTGFEPLFEAIKRELMDITSSMITLDEKTKSIKLNPEFEAGMKEFKKDIQSVIAEWYRFYMLLNKMAGAFTHLVYLGNMFSLSQTGDKLKNWAADTNDLFRKRYLKAEASLQDLAESEDGWKRMTPQKQAEIREASKKGKKIAETRFENIGEGEGNNQLLYYYRDIDKKKPWEKKPPKPDAEDKKSASLKEQWVGFAADMKSDLAKIDADAFGKKMETIANKAADARRKYKKILGPDMKQEIEDWELGMVDDLVNQEVKKFMDERVKITQEGYKTLNELQKEQEDWNVSELQKKKNQNKRWADELKRHVADLLSKEIILPATYRAMIESINKEGGKRDTKETAESIAKDRGFLINQQIAELDLAEKLGMAHRETLGARLALTGQLLTTEENLLQSMIKVGNETAYNSQAEKVKKLRDEIALLNQETMKLKTISGAMTLSLKEVYNDYTNVGQQMFDFTRRTFDSMTDELVNFCETGSFEFNKFAKAVLKDLLRIAIQANVTGPMASGLGGIFKGMFGGGGGGFDMSYFGQGYSAFPALVGGGHKGAIAGAWTSEHLVPYSDIAKAQRYHTGVGPNERVGIFRKDEGIFTREQMKALAPAAGSTNIRIIVNNSASDKVEVTKTEAGVDHQGQYVALWLDAYGRNQMGIKDILKRGE